MELTDAQAMHREHGDRFQVPSPEALAEINVGYFAKVCAEPERFWVLVTALFGDRLRGIIDNDLLKSDDHGLHCGDIIEFELRHVHAIQKSDAASLAMARSATNAT